MTHTPRPVSAPSFSRNTEPWKQPVGLPARKQAERNEQRLREGPGVPAALPGAKAKQGSYSSPWGFNPLEEGEG
jgi:hypothetical protein